MRKTALRPAAALAAAVVASTVCGAARADDPATAAPSAPGLEYTLASGGVRITDGAGTRDLPIADCEPKALAREGDRVYVACGASGIAILDARDPRNPIVAARAPTDGDAVALHVVDGKVWVEIAHVEARPASALLRAARPVEGQSPPRGASGDAGQPDMPAGQARRSLVAPPRRGGLWEVDVGTRAFLPIGNIGFGLLGSGALAYRFLAPVAIHAELAPVGIAGGKQGTIGTAGAHAIVALDTQLFEIGLGVGAATLNSPVTEATSSLSFAQAARIGARDGLAFSYRSNIVVDNDKFQLGAVSVSLQVGLAPSWWFLVAGAGGPVGFAQGDLGIRYLVHGDLGPGSLLLTGTLGGAGVFKSVKSSTTTQGSFTYYRTVKSADYAGPALGVGIEWRL